MMSDEHPDSPFHARQPEPIFRRPNIHMKPYYLSIVAAAAICAPVAAQADAFRPSQGDQVKLGQRAADELRHKEKVLPASDGRVQTLRKIAHRLLSTIHEKTPWQYSFDVIDSKEINAFALPGGPTFFYTGLLDKLKTEDEIAGVLGHELTHVRQEHWAKAYADSQKRSLGLNLLLILGHANRTVGNLAGITNEVLFDLRFSRKDESEADERGFDMMVAGGYNPQGMADVFQLLSDTAKGDRPPEFLSDHPSDARRIAHIKDRIAQGNRSYPPQRPLKNVTYDKYQGWNLP